MVVVGELLVVGWLVVVGGWLMGWWLLVVVGWLLFGSFFNVFFFNAFFLGQGAEPSFLQ